MFKISDFSRLTRVSTKTLRHYDEIGLFKPAQADPFTGYRYYSYDQLPRLNRILVLKGLGFSLDEIRHMLDSDLTPAELRGMFTLRQAQLERQVEQTLEGLKQIEVRLKQIEKEGKMPQIDVLLKQIDPLTIVGARGIVPSAEQMRDRCLALDAQACELIKAASLTTDGISFALYYSDEMQGFDVEMAYVVEPPKTTPASSNQARVHSLPAVTVAYAVYKGSYNDFGEVGQVHNAIHNWAEQNGYRIAGASREFYLNPPASFDNPAGVMEIQYPVEKH